MRTRVLGCCGMSHAYVYLELRRTLRYGTRASALPDIMSETHSEYIISGSARA